ncbi:hypothetical protein HAX54_046067, partial [Datura stramonium]|nr:hypothetical protein [Datura stramonium]
MAPATRYPLRSSSGVARTCSECTLGVSLAWVSPGVFDIHQRGGGCNTVPLCAATTLALPSGIKCPLTWHSAYHAVVAWHTGLCGRLFFMPFC